jgi:predicted GNAT family N-acyltransferase
MSLVSIRKINLQDPLFASVFALRDKVLRQPLGLSLYAEDTSADAHDDIIVALVANEVIACLMLHYVDDQTVKLRQMAVAAAYQGKGIGRQLILAAEAAIQKGLHHHILLHARMTALGFYEKLGYQSFGLEFEEVTIPHIAMQKFL